MKKVFSVCLVMAIILFVSCKKEEAPVPILPTAFQGTKIVTYNQVSVQVVIDKPAQNDLDVLLLFHDTVMSDGEILAATNTTLTGFKNILDRKDMMLVSVAYPEENLLMGDNLAQCEAALLWVKEKAEQEMGITVKKIFLAGHSQGGYLVTRLNTLHQTNGVIANAPGSLNLVYRCQLEGNGQIPSDITCTQLRNTYGTTVSIPDACHQRSLVNFTNGFKSNILFIQGIADSPIQMYSWPLFKQDVEGCTTCQKTQFLELPGEGHGALLANANARVVFNDFIEAR